MALGGGKNTGMGNVYNYGDGPMYPPFATASRTSQGTAGILGHKDITRPGLWRSFLAEFFATIAFTWIVTGALVWGNLPYGAYPAVLTVFQIAAAYGLAFVLSVFVTQHISGGYQNPAITFALMLVGKLTIIRGILYMCAQVAGACIGAALVKGANFGIYNRALGGPNIHNGALSTGGTFLVEAVAATILVWLVLASVDIGYSAYDHGRHIPIISPIAVGLGYFALNLAVVPVDNGGMNPARSFGTAAVYQNSIVWSSHWIYWVGPFVGAIIGAIIYEVAFRRSWISQANTAYVGQDPALTGSAGGYGGVGGPGGAGAAGVGGPVDPAMAAV